LDAQILARLHRPCQRYPTEGHVLAKAFDRERTDQVVGLVGIGQVLACCRESQEQDRATSSDLAGLASVPAANDLPDR